MSVRLIIEFLFQSIAGGKGHFYPPPYGSAKVAVSRFSTIQSPKEAGAHIKEDLCVGGILCKVILLFLKRSEKSTPLPYQRGVKPWKGKPK